MFNDTRRSTSIVLKFLSSSAENTRKWVIKSVESLTPAKRYNCLLALYHVVHLVCLIVKRKAFTVKSIACETRLTNTQQNADCGRHRFHTCTNIWRQTRTMPCVTRVFPPLMASKAVSVLSFVASHPNILTARQIDVKVTELSYSVFSWDSEAVMVIVSAAVRCTAKWHSHPQWPASPPCIQIWLGRNLAGAH